MCGKPERERYHGCTHPTLEAPCLRDKRDDSPHDNEEEYIFQKASARHFRHVGFS